MHSPQSPPVARMAAELGLLVSEEPGVMFADLHDPRITGPTLESLRRLVRRDRNVPSVLAWLLYNECPPNREYAVAAANVIRGLDPDALISFADCSGNADEVRAMVQAAGLSFYGINWYGYETEPYIKWMKDFCDLPLVFTEWGGLWGQGNPRVFTNLCAMFARHVQERQEPRVAGCSYWVWADYEERLRGPQRGAPDGYTIEGLLDKEGRVKSDLQTISLMCYDMDQPAPVLPAKVEVLAKAPLVKDWRAVPLDGIAGDQRRWSGRWLTAAPSSLPCPVLASWRWGESSSSAATPPSRWRRCCWARGVAEIVIPVDLDVRAVAVLGHVALCGGYPHRSEVWEKDPKVRLCEFGAAASEYEFVFEDGAETQTLRHGIDVLRSNNICSAWTSEPHGASTMPAVQTILHPAYEVLRFDLWRTDFPRPRRLKAIRWRWRMRDPFKRCSP